MKNIRLLILSILLSISASAKITQIFDTKLNTYIAKEMLIEQLPDIGFIIIGEFHNEPSIQNAQAELIDLKVKQSDLVGNFKLMWEFLNFTEQESITTKFQNYTDGLISAKQFVTATAGKLNLSYTPLFEVTKKLGGSVVALNLPRKFKTKVVKEGIGSIDPSLVPATHTLGGPALYERFKKSMIAHVPAELIPKYFVAQTLTDSVMAHHAVINHEQLSFVIAGSFHTDFFDATTVKIKRLTSQPITLLKIVSTKMVGPEEITKYLLGDVKYGKYARYIVITD